MNFSKKTLLVWDTELRLPTEETLLDGSGLAFFPKKSSYNSRGQALSISQLDLETAITRTTTAEYCETAEVDAGICPKLGAVKYVDGPLAGSVDRTNFSLLSKIPHQAVPIPLSVPISQRRSLESD
ncbi:hypothetical protein GDR29_05695 [Xanthomonas oryzae pv. oryzae]|nr:hypothetical protein GDR29_05695 [Xanthomonas oryzae pv. oryzae]